MHRFTRALFTFLFLLATPLLSASAPPTPTVVLTAETVDGANDIEGAIISATASGTRDGMVILDGSKGHFVFSTPDRSINIFVPNLTLRGINQAAIENCVDGLFFDNFPTERINIEGLTFYCEGSGVTADGDYRNVSLRDNNILAGDTGISMNGASSGWIFTNNLIAAGVHGIRLQGSTKFTLCNNHISANIGIVLRAVSSSRVRNNALHGGETGILIANESWNNMIQTNTILGVSAAGLALEPGVNGNKIHANRVLCGLGQACATVNANDQTAAANSISGNRP
jgi:parallel beta-helix repeat protein